MCVTTLHYDKRHNYKTFITIVFIVVMTSSCSSISIDSYRNTQPNIQLETFFNGELAAYGIVRDRSGKVIRHFSEALTGTWTDGTGILDEIFWFNDGERQTRIWTMTPNDQGGYTGTAGDVEGSASIQTQGNAINLRYTLRLPYKDSEITVSMDDWMYQVAPGVVINEPMMHKWGIHVGKVTLTIIKKEAVNNLFNFPPQAPK